MKKIAQKAPKEVKEIKESEKQEDYYKGFRSAVVLAWMFCNLILTATVLSTAGLDRVELKSNETQRATIYMAVVLWSVAGLSLFRFCGAVWFLIVRLVSLFTPSLCPLAVSIFPQFANSFYYQYLVPRRLKNLWKISLNTALEFEVNLS